MKTIHFETIDSTNTYLKENYEKLDNFTFVSADFQSAGRGRNNRNWKSEKGENLLFSLLIKDKTLIDKFSSLSVISAFSIIKALNLEYLSIKWPNDIVVNGKKVTGILTEMSAQPEMINYIVIGIGINVNTEEFPEDIAKTASSLKIESGKTIKRSSIIALFGKYFEQYYAKYIKTQDMSLLIDEYNKELINVDRQIKVLAKENSYTGIAKGINRHGELIVETENKELKNVVAGEVSVRGLYGYV